MKICYAASSGGHLNQIKELFDKVKCDSFYIITEKTAQSKVLLKKLNTVYVINMKRNILKIVVNFCQSIIHIIKNNPNVIITTGAGSTFFTVLVGKILGKKVISIESIARVTQPSLFGKIVYHMSDLFIVQWRTLLNHYKKATYGGSILNFSQKKNTKQKKIFVSVGVSPHGFDRLIKLVDKLPKRIFNEYEVFGQIGTSQYLPKKFAYKRYLTPAVINKFYKNSEISICHAGSGSIYSSITNGCKTIVVPRYKKFREHVDNHQSQISEEFEKLNLVFVLREQNNLISLIEKAINTKIHPYKQDNLIPQLINKYLHNKKYPLKYQTKNNLNEVYDVK